MEFILTMRTCVFLSALSTNIALLALQAHGQTPAEALQAAPTSQSSSPSSDSGPLDPRNTRIVSDPLYLPLKGQVYGVTAYTLDMPKGDNYKAGVKTGSFQSSDSLINQTLAYGLLNDLTIRLAMGYGVNQRDLTAETTGDVTTGNASGFSDPILSATYRVLDEIRSPAIVDLTGSYSPDAITSKASGGGNDGTIARGGRTAGFSLAVGREMKSFTIAGTAATTYVGREVTELLSNSTSSESDAHWSYDIGLDTQTRFTDRVSLNAGVSYTTAGNYTVSNVQTGNPHPYDAPHTRALNVALNGHFLPNRLVGAITYTYNNYTDAQNTFARPASDTAVQNRIGNVVGVRLMYAFN
jgi:hypothetical protein